LWSRRAGTGREAPENTSARQKPPDDRSAFIEKRRDCDPVTGDRVLAITRFVQELTGQSRGNLSCLTDNDVLVALLNEDAGGHQARLGKSRKVILERIAPTVSFEHVKFPLSEPNRRRRRNFPRNGELGRGATEGRLDNHRDASLICAAWQNL
jgi:hypothetical protein